MIDLLVLASASPRRKQLLELAGISFQIKVSEVDETPHQKETPKKMVARLSRLKAETVSALVLREKGSFIVLAADTTVVNEQNKNLGKPQNLKEATQMIASLQGRVHHVYTAYTLIKFKNKKRIHSRTRTIRTDVWIKKMNQAEISRYVKRGESLDKAGAYAAQGAGMALIEKIKGSYTNVVGLPLTQVLQDLKELDIFCG